MPIDAIILHPMDNVATALQELRAGQEAEVRLDKDLTKSKICENIPYGHKFAVKKISCGENIIKYGETIGRATEDISAGYHAHVQNIESLRGRGDLRKEDQ